MEEGAGCGAHHRTPGNENRLYKDMTHNDCASEPCALHDDRRTGPPTCRPLVLTRVYQQPADDSLNPTSCDRAAVCQAQLGLCEDDVISWICFRGMTAPASPRPCRDNNNTRSMPWEERPGDRGCPSKTVRKEESTGGESLPGRTKRGGKGPFSLRSALKYSIYMGLIYLWR